MRFPLNVYLATLFCSALGTWVALPFWRRWCEKLKLVDDPGHRKIHSQPVALAGGLAVITGLFATLAIGLLVLQLNVVPDQARSALIYGFSKRAWQLLAIGLGAVAMLLLGFLDDAIELRPLPKFIGQAAIAFLVAASGVRITLFIPNLAVSYAFTILWILTVTNAFNFMDNMNGLCTGLGAIGAWFFALIAASSGQYLVGLIAFAVFGATLGFLPYNYPKASAFLGDAGSHLVGYLLAVIAILPHFYTTIRPRKWAVLDPIAVLALPLLDLLCVVWIRTRRGQPFYLGDTNHLSHRLVRRGWNKSMAVALIWLAATIMGAFTLL